MNNDEMPDCLCAVAAFCTEHGVSPLVRDMTDTTLKRLDEATREIFRREGRCKDSFLAGVNCVRNVMNMKLLAFSSSGEVITEDEL